MEWHESKKPVLRNSYQQMVKYRRIGGLASLMNY